MSVWKIELNSYTPTGVRRFVICETIYPDMEELVRDLRDGPIVVQRLSTIRVEGEDGVWEIVGRRALGLTWHGITEIQTPDGRYVEYDE